MWRETKILLIHDHMEQRKEFTHILTFLDENFLASSSAQWRSAVADLNSSRGILCVMLGGVTDPQYLTGLIKELTEWDEFLPIILLDDASPVKLLAEVQQSILTRLEMPPSYSQLLGTLHRAQVYREVYDETAERGTQRVPDLFRSLVGASRCIQSVRQMMQQVANTEASVLILGESGTGKEVIARNLHYNSKRRDWALCAD